MIEALIRFAHIEPKLPGSDAKRWSALEPILLDTTGGRDAFIAQIYALRLHHPIADLAVAAYRDMKHTDWKPFLKAAYERNPVIHEAAKEWSVNELAVRLSALPNQSIYAERHRVAQPDEVWNFGRGDGLEKAIVLASVLFRRENSTPALHTEKGSTGTNAVVESEGKTFVFPSEKETAAINNFL